MSDDEDYNSGEDLDFMPSDDEQVSEEENSGEEEDFSLLYDGVDEVKSGSRRKPTTFLGGKSDVIGVRKRKSRIILNDETEVQNDTYTSNKEEKEEEMKRKEELANLIEEEQEKKKKEKEKKRADDLWSSFLADTKKIPARPAQNSSSTGFGLGSLSSQIKQTANSDTSAKESPSISKSGDKTGKVTITKVFDFAGEEIKITKEVEADSKEGKAEQRKQEKMEEDKTTATTISTSTSGGTILSAGLKRPASGGLSRVLNKISKKNKMGTLEKSKLDWNAFKHKEGIVEDLKIHNKGKQGYMERMAFLNRADQRQFELERDLRMGKSSKR